MSASRRIVIARYPLSPPYASAYNADSASFHVSTRRIDVEVWYPTLRDMTRRYSLSVQPVTVREDGVTVYTPTEGYRATIEDAPRYSARRLEALAADPAVLELAARMVERVRADEAERNDGRKAFNGWAVLPADDPRPF